MKIYNPTSSTIFNVGDKIYCEDYKKSGKIISIRDDSYERKEREKYPNHPIYYHIKFDDGSFDTYVSANSISRVYHS